MPLETPPVSPASINSPLIDYAVRGLDRCWLPNEGRWSHIYHLDGRSPPNESVPHSDVFYTLNVLLGFSRVPKRPASVDVAQIFQRNAQHLLALPVRKYAFGMALWAGAELGLALPSRVVDEVDAIVRDKNTWSSFRAQDVGMLLTGAAAQVRAGEKRWSAAVEALYSHIASSYAWPSGLFSDASAGPRKRFASFASQVYSTLACYAYGELKGDERAIDLANQCSRKIIALQGPQGEWPWFFSPPNGQVVDFYEVYSVHQLGMAPAVLEVAERHGVSEAREALAKGFRWVFGENQLGKVMLARDLCLTIRSQIRKGELHTDKRRVLRALANSALRRSAPLANPSGLDLRLECRSYELGWILWSFGGRTDFPELTNHKLFADLVDG
jgi:hypothetical protein